MEGMMFGESVKSFDELAAASMLATAEGKEFAVPDNNAGFSWQTVLGTNPDAISMQLQISLDGSNWTALDTSTAVGGEVRYIAGSAKFVRGYIGSITLGSGDELTLEISLVRGG